MIISFITNKIDFPSLPRQVRCGDWRWPVKGPWTEVAMGIPPAAGGAEAVVTGLSLVSPAEKRGQSLWFLTFFFLLKISLWCNLFFTMKQGVKDY